MISFCNSIFVYIVIMYPKLNCVSVAVIVLNKRNVIFCNILQASAAVQAMHKADVGEGPPPKEELIVVPHRHGIDRYRQ